MRRSGPLKRLSPLKAKTELRRTGLTRAREPKDAPEAARFRKTVMWRCDGRCEARTPVCTLRAVHAHHILPRGMGGGSKHDPELGIGVCRECHVYIHDPPADGLDPYEQGWLMRHGGQT